MTTPESESRRCERSAGWTCVPQSLRRAHRRALSRASRGIDLPQVGCRRDVMHAWNGRRDGALPNNAGVLGVAEPAFVLLRDLIAQQTGVFYDDPRSDLLADKL